MSLSITRRFEFDAGHRIVGHESKCANLHGHRYVAEVSFSGPSLDYLNRVLDFGEAKKLIGTWIEKHWDHNMILSDKDPLLRHPELFQDKRPYVLEGRQPTAEVLVVELYSRLAPLAPKQTEIIHVRLYETPNCWADISQGSLNTPCGIFRNPIP